MSDSTPRDEGDERRQRRDHGRPRGGAGASRGHGDTPRSGASRAGASGGNRAGSGRAGGEPGGRRSDGGGTERKPWEKRDGSASRSPGKPWEKRDGAAPRSGGPGKPWQKRDGGQRGGSKDARGGEKRLWTRDGKPARGDRDAARREDELTEEQKRARELRSVRPRHDDPEIPEDVAANQLDKVARAELKTLSKDNADAVARHLIMAGRLIDDDPAEAHRHAMSAGRRAGRVAVVRETLAITAYATGDFALALRELRTYRRISGSENQLALMVDSERGVGRPDRALELGRSVERSSLPAEVQAALAIAMSGARLDLGQTDAALAELEVPQLDPSRVFAYSPDLFRAYAEVLADLGRATDAERWNALADRADDALADAAGGDDETVDVIEEDVEIATDAGSDGSDEHVESVPGSDDDVREED